MKNGIKLVLITLIVILTCTQTTLSQSGSTLKKISLIYSDPSPPDTGGAIFLKQEYLPRVNKELAKIGYELDITFYHNGSLYKFADQIQACEAGLVDITLLSLDYELKRAPLHEIISIPLLGYNEYSATRIWFELQETIPEFGAELSEFKELFHFMALPTVFNMNRVARLPKDYKGLKIQSAGMVADMFRSIGANPIQQSPMDWHSSLKMNLIDGVITGITGIPMFNLQDVVKVHIQPTGDSLGLTGTSFIMSRKRFNSFPQEVQKIINDNVMWASMRMTEIEVKNIPKNEQLCRKLGNKFVTLTPEEMNAWYDVIRPLHKQWIKKMNDMGLPGEKVYNEAKRLAEKYRNKK
jgi:TRAP-type transport system periplasmic protein